jgi:hypothetical protein
MTALIAPDPTPLGPAQRIAAFMAGFSIEVTRPSADDVAALTTA